jgi:hypothetical protein
MDIEKFEIIFEIGDLKVFADGPIIRENTKTVNKEYGPEWNGETNEYFIHNIRIENKIGKILSDTISKIKLYSDWNIGTFQGGESSYDFPYVEANLISSYAYRIWNFQNEKVVSQFDNDIFQWNGKTLIIKPDPAYVESWKSEQIKSKEKSKEKDTLLNQDKNKIENRKLLG